MKCMKHVKNMDSSHYSTDLRSALKESKICNICASYACSKSKNISQYFS